MNQAAPFAPAPPSRDLHPALDVIAFFKARSALVAAAVKALEAMPPELAAVKAALGSPSVGSAWAPVRRLVALIQSAAVGSDNLLVVRAGVSRDPFVVCAVGRRPDGAVDVRTIELDREALALMEEGRTATCVLDRLTRAIEVACRTGEKTAVAGAAAALDACVAQVRSATSRLAIVDARLDLQERLLANAVETRSSLPEMRLDSHLTGARARDMALEARRLLSARPVTIANGERKPAPPREGI